MAAYGRPFGVTLIGVLMIIGGLLTVIAGIIALFSGDTAGLGIVALIVSIVIGLIYLALAKGILVGSAGARLVVAVVTVINMIFGFLHLFSNLTLGLSQLLVGLVILLLLYSAKAKAFFA